MERALLVSDSLGLLENRVVALKGLGMYFLVSKNTDEAMRYSLEALALSDSLNFLREKSEILDQLADICYMIPDVEQALYYDELTQITRDSLLNKDIQENILDIKEKYAASEREHRISMQNAQLQKRKFLIVGLATIVFLLLIAVLFYVRFQKQKQVLQLQKIRQLETEKQLTATESVMRGEEKERSRLARDLHDGLGGMLTGIKYSLGTMKGNLILKAEDAMAFERSIDMLDSSIKEMRRVAHSLLPEALVKYGLDMAVKDFCSDISQSGKMKIIYQSFGMENLRIENDYSKTIYRIVQELIGNALKHSGAREVVLQLSCDDSTLSMTVEDNGSGFAVEDIENTAGIGLKNIRSRIDYLKGSLDIDSSPEGGTSVFIEINLDQLR